MIICFGYPSDLEQMYAFYCARYSNISYDEFLKLGIEEFSMKLNSIPKSEPLYEIIKSRTINLGKIKDKEERKYWRELKKINRIPDIYKSSEEIEQEMKNDLKNYGGSL
jgi:predicted RNA-binding protein with PUA domain